MTEWPNLKDFRRFDDRLALLLILVDYLVIVAAALVAILANSLPITFLALMLIAGRQIALMNIMHAAGHYTLFASKRKNDSLEFLFAYPILNSVLSYRRPHLQHHLEFATLKPNRFEYLHEYLRLPVLDAWGRTWVVFIRPFLGHAAIEFIREIIGNFSENRRQFAKILAYWIGLVTIFSVVGWLPYLVIFWIVPLFWLFPVFVIWAEISDHFDAEGEVRNQCGVFYPIFLKGHETYHAVHHLYPYIPFYRLGVAHQYLVAAGSRMEESRGFVDFVRIVYRSAVMSPNPKTIARFPSVSDLE